MPEDKTRKTEQHLRKAEMHLRQSEEHIRRQEQVIRNFEMIGNERETTVAREILETLKKSRDLAAAEVADERERLGRS